MSNRPPPMTPMEWVALVLTVAVLIFVAWANIKGAYSAEPLKLIIDSDPRPALVEYTGAGILNINSGLLDLLYVNGVKQHCYPATQEPTPMTTPPINDKGKTERKPEHPDIVRARADVNNAADEHARAKVVYEVTGRKLQQAQEALNAELVKPRRE